MIMEPRGTTLVVRRIARSKLLETDISEEQHSDVREVVAVGPDVQHIKCWDIILIRPPQTSLATVLGEDADPEAERDTRSVVDVGDVRVVFVPEDEIAQRAHGK